jgi:four helix bundle protein
MSRTALKSYQDLVSWQQAMELALACYRLAKAFPASERFGLASQLTRAACSVPSNIAEGYGRRGRADYLRCLSIARGSLMEVETQLLIARDLAYGSAQERDAALSIAQSTGRVLGALMRSLGDRNAGGTTRSSEERAEDEISAKSAG